jgi:acetyltransferase-like isoleucine patch superfamily enzyme
MNAERTDTFDKYNNYLSREELSDKGFRSIGKDVYISRKANIYGARNMALGDNIRIDDGTIVTGKVDIGSHVHIAANCYVSGGEAGIVLEDITGVAPYVYITTSSDDYSGKAMFSPVIPQKFKKITIAPIYIRKYSIIGAYSMIMPGVELAEGTSVGAMTFMRKKSQEWGIYFGCPAKMIGTRDKGIIEMSKQFLSEYELSAADKD